jgi:prevent-host-death family protein
MSDDDAGPDMARAPSSRVGVRELRQNLSVYLQRVKQGEALEVMERGHPVAVLVPLRPGSTMVDRLVATGRAARGVGDPRDLPRPKGRPSTGVAEVLAGVDRELS